jgi:hypothetical protein
VEHLASLLPITKKKAGAALSMKIDQVLAENLISSMRMEHQIQIARDYKK